MESLSIYRVHKSPIGMVVPHTLSCVQHLVLERVDHITNKLSINKNEAQTLWCTGYKDDRVISYVLMTAPSRLRMFACRCTYGATPNASMQGFEFIYMRYVCVNNSCPPIVPCYLFVSSSFLSIHQWWWPSLSPLCQPCWRTTTTITFSLLHVRRQCITILSHHDVLSHSSAGHRRRRHHPNASSSTSSWRPSNQKKLLLVRAS